MNEQVDQFIHGNQSDERNLAVESGFWSKLQAEVETEQQNHNRTKMIATMFIAQLLSHPNYNREMVFQLIRQIQDEILTPIVNLICEVVKPLVSHELQPQILNAILDLCKIFESVKSEYKFINYLKEINLFHDPMVNCLELELEALNVSDNITLKETRRGGVYIGIKNLFNRIFSNEHDLRKMLEFCEMRHSPENELDSFMKAEFWQNKISTYKDKKCIPYMLYSDAFEINNPLGSKAGKQSLNGYYLSFPALPRYLTGITDNIFLIMFGYSKVEKEHSNEEILHNLITEIIELEQKPMEFNLDGRLERVYFLFGGLRGDNLGLNTILDYSRSFNANYHCRFCIMHIDQMKEAVFDDPALYRTQENYEEALISSNFSESGIHRNSAFNAIPNFHITELKIVDAMHDIYEGYAHDALTACLHYFLTQGKSRLTLEMLNERIRLFDYEYNDKRNKPEPISMEQIRSSKLKTSAGQIKSLLENILLMIGDLIDDSPQWKYLIEVVKISELIMKPSYTIDSLQEMQIKISNNLQQYKTLFDRHLKPKAHLLTHYSLSIRHFGPPKYTSCFLPEAKHKIFKKIAKTTACRKNIALTVAIKDQLSLAYKRLSNTSFFGLPFITPGKAYYYPVREPITVLPVQPVHESNSNLQWHFFFIFLIDF